MQESPTYSVSIHLGASSLSLIIHEKTPTKEIEIDYLEQAIPMARDIFQYGRVKRDTIERAVTILENYLKNISEFGLSAKDIKVAAISNIINESKNAQIVVNRLAISSGIQFIVLDNGSMTRLVYQKIRRRQEEASFTNSGITLAIHVGPGNTRVLMLNEGKVERFTSYRLGCHRTAEALRKSHTSGNDYLQMIRSHCEALINSIKYDYRKKKIENVILIGYELQLVSRLLGESELFSESIKTYSEFIELAADLTEEERVQRFQLDYHSEDAFLPALQINYTLLHAFNIKRFWIPKTQYEKGLLSDLDIVLSNKERKLEGEILHSARLLAQKYEADPYHYEQVRMLVESIFEQTQHIHSLGKWELLLLQTATIVHEIGGYVSSRMHHKHSYYLVKNSEIFGLDERHQRMIALIARYHRQSPPKPTHKDYTSLSQHDQIIVSKLSALLRIADALDTAQQQRIKKVLIKQNGDTLKLLVSGVNDLNLERIALKNKGDLFEQLYGLDLQLEHVLQHKI